MLITGMVRTNGKSPATEASEQIARKRLARAIVDRYLLLCGIFGDQYREQLKENMYTVWKREVGQGYTFILDKRFALFENLEGAYNAETNK